MISDVGDVLLAPRVFDGFGSIPNGAVWIEKGEIQFCGPITRLPAEAAEARRIEFPDATICPGFIDLHAHFVGCKQYSMHSLALTDEREGALRAVPRALDLLLAGFTAARDVGSGVGPFLRDAIDEGSIEGPRIAPARAILSQTGGHCDVHSLPAEFLCRSAIFRLCDGPDDCRKAVREQFRAGADVIKFCATGGILSERDHSHQEQFTDLEVEAIVEEAHRLGMRTACHAQGTAGVKRALRAGTDTIEHGCFLDREAIDLFLEKDATLVPTLAIVHQICEHGAEFGVPPRSVDKAKRVRDAHVQSLQNALQAGVRIATGTDFIGGQANSFRDAALEIELLVRAGASPQQALRAATSNAARAISRKGLAVYEQQGPQWWDRIGSLAPGNLADIVILKGDPLENISAVRRVQAVIKGGRFIAGAPPANVPGS